MIPHDPTVVRMASTTQAGACAVSDYKSSHASKYWEFHNKHLHHSQAALQRAAHGGQTTTKC